MSDSSVFSTRRELFAQGNEAVAEAAQGKDAVWMAGHGLCCLGRNLGDALCLAEELEHLAALQILATA